MRHWDYEIYHDKDGWYLSFEGFDVQPTVRYSSYAAAEEVRKQWLQEDEDAQHLADDGDA